MLEFFRKYQRYFFIVIATMTISSFLFFGAFSTYDAREVRAETPIGKLVSGAPLLKSEIAEMGRLLENGVIQKDFLATPLGSLLVESYMDVIKPHLATRLEKAKKFKAYIHPESSAVSADKMWQRFVPELPSELKALKAQSVAGLETYGKLAHLYLLQMQLPPETLRRVLAYQQQNVTPDPRLMQEDLSLFGFHTLQDWFGKDFVDVVAQFVLNAAVIAEEKGYSVSSKEAKGDLVHTYREHVRELGLPEARAVALWQKVLLFRKFFEDVGGAAFLDHLPFKEFAAFAGETRVVEEVRYPIALRTAQDMADFELYVKLTAAKVEKGLPTALLSVDEVEKSKPELVQTTYRAKIAEVPKAVVEARISLKDYWGWELDEANWASLRKEFFLSEGATRAARFEALELLAPEKRAEVDAFAKEAVLKAHPEWIEEELAKAEAKEVIWSGNGAYGKENVYTRVEELEKIEDKHIVPFVKARAILSKMNAKAKDSYTPEESPFYTAAKAKKLDLPEQFKPRIATREITRADGAKEVFALKVGDSSQVLASESGEISYFRVLEEKKTETQAKEQLLFGKATLAADAKAWAAEKILTKIKQENAIKVEVK